MLVFHRLYWRSFDRQCDNQTVLTGLAPNGGLYIPEHIPQLPKDWKTEWSTYSFVDLSVAVLSLYISSGEISRNELRSLVQKSYQTFRHPDVTPLVKLGEKKYILELFHGPTFAFKDVALQLLGNLFEFFLLRRNAKKPPKAEVEKLTVVGATSGDTGRYAETKKTPVSVLNCLKAQQFMAFGENLMFQYSFFTRKVASRQFRKHK
jgi:threonine synthase